MDQLSAIFSRYAPTAKVFYSGSICQRAAFDTSQGVGYIHILRAGKMSVLNPNGEQLDIEQPSVLFYPRPAPHSFQSCSEISLELLCASIDLGNPVSNPFCDALPEFVVVPLNSLNGVEPLLKVLFLEAFSEHSGRQVALDNLVTYFLILLLRQLIESEECHIGMLAGLNDAKLSKALTAVHEKPALQWNLEKMADIAGMSRARFAAHFRLTIGNTPMDYVSRWRMGVAQSLLKQGYSIKQIAPKVGYQSAAAMTRTFTSRLGSPPSEWLKSHRIAMEAQTEQNDLGNYISKALIID